MQLMVPQLFSQEIATANRFTCSSITMTMIENHSKRSISDLSVLTASTEATGDSYQTIDPLLNTDENDCGDDCSSVISSLTDSFTNSLGTVNISNNICIQQRRVSFGFVEVREYERIAGDHPETSMGVPLAIGWKFKAQPIQSIDRYTNERRGRNKCKPVRLGAMTRKKLLLEVSDVPLCEIRMAELALKKYKKKMQTIKEGENKVPEETKSKNIFRGLRKGIMKRCGMKAVVVVADLPTSMAVACA
jgi:hypothetical protein